MKWFELAARQGDSLSQNVLGDFNERGYGVAQSYTQAARWHGKAAKQGNGFGMASLARLYASGRGVPLDLVQAYAWMSAAAAQGRHLAKQELARLERRLTTQQLQEAQELSQVYWEQYGAR